MNKNSYLSFIFIISLLGHINYAKAQDTQTFNNVLKSFDLENLSVQNCFSIDSLLTVSRDTLNNLDKIKYYTPLYQSFLRHNIPIMAITYVNSLIPLYQKANNKKELADLYSDKSLVHDYLAQYPQALKASQKSLELYIKIDDKQGEANSYNDIGILHYYSGSDSLAANYHNLSFEIYKEINDSSGMAMYYNNMANTFYDMEEFPNAILMYTKAREINVLINDLAGESIALSNIGETYVFLGEYRKAEKILLEALELAKKTKDPWNITNPLRGLGKLYTLTNQIPKAVKVLEESVELSIDIDALAEQSESYNLLYQLYKSSDNYKDALYYFEKYKISNDSIFSQAKEQMSAEMEMKYQIQDKAKKIELLNTNKALDDLEHIQQISKQKNNVIYLVGGLVCFFIILLFAIRGFLLKKKANKKLRVQNTIIKNKNKEINHAYLQIEEKNNEILDSIRYAKRIQSAILPSQSQILKLLPKSFVFYRPKDVVAGDFYWLEEKDNKILIAAADCTGHGVPGAMISVVCNNALKRTVREYGLTDPGKILDKTREIVIDEFSKSDEDVKDGMDIALVTIQNNLLEYAGAHNPLWIIRGNSNEIEEIKANKQPIGLFDSHKPYTTHKVKLSKGDTFYIFSDGFADQFGGEKGKKYKKSNLKGLLLSCQQNSMEKQKNLISEAFDEWKGDIEQLDDVCVIGVKI
jgi:serine phosphatase RsbU (regulator of sigma subunit)